MCVATSCGDPGDNGSMYNWKDVWYAFDMVEEETSLKGLQVEITYLDPLSIERRYNYSKFGQWDTIFHHLPWEFIPRMKATVIQPEDVEFTGLGKSPLTTSESFNNAPCPKCGKMGRREMDTMDTFVCSSWYFLRYCDPHCTPDILYRRAQCGLYDIQPSG